MDASWLAWPAAVALGCAVGISELVSRYKDDPVAALREWPALLYIAVNGAASAGALGLIYANGWFAGSAWTQILVAGVSAMAFFRSSLFTVRAGDRDVGVGPSGFLQIFLTAADRAVDRRRGAARSDTAALVMRGVDFDKAVASLPALCIALMQNLPPEDQKVLSDAVKELRDSEAEPSVKVLLLGIELMNVVGADVLTTAVETLGDQIRSAPAGP